ncbi:hypothetical protein SAMN05428988_6014 [Chitinophaga sp. YR573]|nr:hypothetical protein SAMN05428988_6014 [Chitinophaga sp. YR573]
MIDVSTYISLKYTYRSGSCYNHLITVLNICYKFTLLRVLLSFGESKVNGV